VLGGCAILCLAPPVIGEASDVGVSEVRRPMPIYEIYSKNIVPESNKILSLKTANFHEGQDMFGYTKVVWEIPNELDACKSYNLTFMPYTAVTSESSNQYQLLYSDECYTDQSTGIRVVNDRYCIALGTAYTDVIGTKVDVVMANGSTIPCILGDVKNPAHTDSTNRYQQYDGSVVEFIIDSQYFTGTEQYPDDFSGDVVELVVYEEIEEIEVE